jgi:hypothetical protein
MAFCKYCGKEIPDGSVCDCAESQLAATNLEKPETPANKKNTKPVIIAVIVVIVLVIIALCTSGGGYKAPIDDCVKSLNNCDGELLLESMLTKSMIKDLDDDEIDSIDSMLEYAVEFLEEEYGDDIKVSVKIKSKEKLTDDELDEISESYEDYFDETVKIKKGYAVKVKIKVKGDDDSDTNTTTLNVVKIKGGGWKLSPDSFGSF